jgi:hypothetical protein
VLLAGLLAETRAADRRAAVAVASAPVRAEAEALVPVPGAAGWTAGGRDGLPPEAAICRTAGSPAILLLGAPPHAEGTAQVRVWTAPGGEEGAGLVFRWRDPQDYYLARLNTRTNGLRLFRHEGGQTTLLAGWDLPIPVGLWHTLAVRVGQGRVEVALDGEPLLAGEDASWVGQGLGLWVGSETRACFGAVRLAPAVND